MKLSFKKSLFKDIFSPPGVGPDKYCSACPLCYRPKAV